MFIACFIIGLVVYCVMSLLLKFPKQTILTAFLHSNPILKQEVVYREGSYGGGDTFSEYSTNWGPRLPTNSNNLKILEISSKKMR